MPQSPLTKPERLAQWTHALGDLVAQVEGWSAELGWATARQPKKLREKALGTYEVDDLIIKTPACVLVLDVKGGDVANAQGRVDLYVLHNLNRMLLIRTGDRWTLKTDTGVRWPKPWSKQTLAELPELVASAA